MSNNTINETLAQFINEGPIWDALNNLKERYGTRYGAHAHLIELVRDMDVDALDEACETGAAMYLANELCGQKTFKATMAEAILQAIRLDAEDGDLTGRDARMLRQQVKVCGLL